MAEADDDDFESLDLDDDKSPALSRDLAEADDADDADEGDFDDDDLEDAEEDEIDYVIASYREDGQVVVSALGKDLANDLDELIVQLRRLPGDAGAIGFVSLVEEVAVIVRVRGQHVQVLLSDAAAAADWPIARDVADYLGEEIPDEEDEEDAEPMGDLRILADLGVSEFDLTALCDDLDLSSEDLLAEVADKIKIGPQFRRVAEAALSD
ncbi:tRNA adenosine deaminase-associated protein [Microlunatus kandeliicorticis]|uniref:tRNA adenosine deaminase-associated protein n=1 Tax=Microlunatus kandeliicorticis TaxID=1759536 RepID=UPI0015F7E459